MPDLLYEIGTEELPAGYLGPGLEQLAGELERRLREADLPPERLRTAGTPRRMTVAAAGIPSAQPPRRSRTVGPPAAAAYDEDGNPTEAARGFARSRGVAVEDLRVEETEKGPYVVAVREEEGAPATELLPTMLREATAAVTFPKSMRWESSGFSFARPIRRLVALLGREVLPLEIAGVRAGRATRGHPFLAPEEIELADACFEDYCELLREHFVLADAAERRRKIRTGINAVLEEHGSELEDAELLGEVANLVEWPHVVEGRFEEEFLGVPAPILEAAMKEHQRCFPVRDAEGNLRPLFLAVSNRTAEQDELVREGNERVLEARLDDAAFYWEQDRRVPLEQMVARLEEVVFLGGLGDNLQRTGRLEELAGRLAAEVGGADTVEHVRRAAHLCKADLVSGVVGEFPNLQGVVGRELARLEGECEPVARAVAEHYLPAGADDELPATLEGSCLALADKLDAIVGCFSLGLEPSGSQDPYALRRNALGILLIIEEKALELDLREIVEAARQVAAEHGIECEPEKVEDILEFFRDRLYHAAIERGHPHDFVRAVLAAGYRDVGDFWQRLQALRTCSRREWWPALVELVDRTYRIQRDEEIRPVDSELLEEPLERHLGAALDENRGRVADLFEESRYVEGAREYCSAFAELVHDFFEEVFVNVEDEDLRANRKSLCGRVYHLFADHFADLYRIETAEPTR